LLELMDAIVDRPFTIVGDLVLDRYQYCDAADIAPDAPNMSLVPLEHRDFLGGAAIIARHLAGLGAEPTLVTSLGTDDASDAALDTLESAGVHVLPIRNRKKIATKTRFVVDTQKLFTLDECPATPTDSTNEKYVLEQAKKHASVEGQQASLVMYDAGLGLLTDSLAAAVIGQSRGAEGRYGKIFAATASSRGKLTRLTDADLLVATERAIRIATRDHEQGVSALACRVLADHRAGALLMPLGKKGLMTFDAPDAAAFGKDTPWEGKLRSEYVASPINGTVDRLGSDEALLATAAALLSAPSGAGAANLHQAAYTALLASILTSRHAGHAPLDGHELRTLLESRPELAD
jgi:bifunctional ADP-heptose synthase (sugar kinase/adenylyltransferase)